MQMRKAVRAWVYKFDATGEISAGPDSLAGEEPLEIQLNGEQYTVTMRTAGHDVELIAGYLLSEAVVTSMDDIDEVNFSAGLAPDGSRNYNVAQVRLAPGIWKPETAPARNVYTSSSCGICGTAAADAVTKTSAFPLIPAAFHVEDQGEYEFPQLLSAARIGELPDRLRQTQEIFAKTGGVHAAALFAVGDDPNAEPELLVGREDVGRHNAVDKVIGWAMANRGLPLRSTVLQVSARASFELVQKCAMAGIPMMSAVSAPSAMAVDYGKDVGVSVIGFNRKGKFNAYSYPERVA
ncbi:FdhD protein [Brevibacterium iodinum ATCC 49514]|uniref:Sulfur carrier protein FdhD n=1 Tax=Brevibacterium iodinum ATCC 49514 TaxID=1255616 RepID=A0A2H1HRP1_9MICO|nr:formate dehydrogenase accessory sulfurtransferase FdhD [Brevibacterium iodinum]SMX65605.1 FdhD protein [Brevibacterium iodinum ATCC 49514]SUW13467.1 formate dehydrogenase accessory protein [Brevibacterium iodinum]